MATLPREVTIRMTVAQRKALEAYLHAGREIEAVGAGGTRYGGKTFLGSHCIGYRRIMYPGTRALALRTIQRASDLNMGEELKDAFFKSHGITVGSRNRGQVQWIESEKRFLFPNGSMIQLGYCRRPNDWEQHLGLQWDDIWFEQAEQFPEKVYSRLGGSNRPSCDTKCLSRRLCTFNPGGMGQEWLERRIVNPQTRDRRVLWVESSVRNCLATLERDPGYILRSLMSITDPILRQQWLDGSWEAQAGIYFRLMPDMDGLPGTVQNIVPPYWADWYCGVDWGFHKPFSCVWVARWEEKGKHRIHAVAEVYESGLDLDTQAERVLEKDKALKKQYPFFHGVEIRMADPSTATVMEKESEEQARSKASVWRDHGLDTYPSFRYSRTARWNLFRYLIRHRIMTVSPECGFLIREFKSALRKEGGEDIDQARSEDHALDALSYITGYLFGMDYTEQPVDQRREELKSV